MTSGIETIPICEAEVAGAVNPLLSSYRSVAAATVETGIVEIVARLIWERRTSWSG
jgi:hypothetical protein